MTTTPRCARCGRPLTDPASIAIGLGRECRGAKPSKRQASYARRVARGEAYANREPLVFPSTTFTPQPYDTWLDAKTGRLIPDDRFVDWLTRNNLIILPADATTEMEARRERILAALASQTFLPHEFEELCAELSDLSDKLGPSTDDIPDALRYQRTEEAKYG